MFVWEKPSILLKQFIESERERVINHQTLFLKPNDALMYHPNTILSQSLYNSVYFHLKAAAPIIPLPR